MITASARRSLKRSSRQNRYEPSRPAGMRALSEMQLGGDEPGAALVDEGAPTRGRALGDQRAHSARCMLALDRRHVDCPVRGPKKVPDRGLLILAWSRCPPATGRTSGTAPRRAPQGCLYPPADASKWRIRSEDCIVCPSECQSNSRECEARINMIKTVVNQEDSTPHLLL